VPFDLQVYHQHHTVECRQYRNQVFLGRGKTPAQKFGNFHQCMHAQSDSRLLLQKWSKSVQDKWPKGRITLITQKNKTRFGTLGRNPWGNFPHFSCVSAHRDPKKVSTRPQGKCNIGSLSLPITRSHQLLRWGTMPQQWAKKWEGGCAPCVGGDGSPSITMSPGRRPTCVPSGILIHLAVWPQQTWAEQRF